MVFVDLNNQLKLPMYFNSTRKVSQKLDLYSTYNQWYNVNGSTVVYAILKFPPQPWRLWTQAYNVNTVPITFRTYMFCQKDKFGITTLVFTHNNIIII